MGYVYAGFGLLGILLAVASRLWRQGARPGQYLPSAAYTLESALLLACFGALALTYQSLCNRRLWLLSPDLHRAFAPLILLLLVSAALDLVLLNVVATAAALFPDQIDERAYSGDIEALGRWANLVSSAVTVAFCIVLGWRYSCGASMSANGPGSKTG